MVQRGLHDRMIVCIEVGIRGRYLREFWLGAARGRPQKGPAYDRVPQRTHSRHSWLDTAQAGRGGSQGAEYVPGQVMSSHNRTCSYPSTWCKAPEAPIPFQSSSLSEGLDIFFRNHEYWLPAT